VVVDEIVEVVVVVLCPLRLVELGDEAVVVVVVDGFLVVDGFPSCPQLHSNYMQICNEKLKITKISDHVTRCLSKFCQLLHNTLCEKSHLKRLANRCMYKIVAV